MLSCHQAVIGRVAARVTARVVSPAALAPVAAAGLALAALVLAAGSGCGRVSFGGLPAVGDASADGAAKADASVVGAWEAGPWSACSETCTTGVQTRSVTCVDSLGNALPPSACPPPEPAREQACQVQACTWATSDWTACSTTCGANGMQTRTAACVTDQGQAAPEAQCGARPTEAQRCNLVACCRNLASAQTEFSSGPQDCGGILRYMVTPVMASLQQRCLDLGYDTYSGTRMDFDPASWCGGFCNARTKLWSGTAWQNNACDVGVQTMECCHMSAPVVSAPGEAALGRAGRVCATPAVLAAFGEAHFGWSIQSAPNPTPAQLEPFLCDIGGDATVTLRAAYAGAVLPGVPTIALQRNATTTIMDYSYVVERVAQPVGSGYGLLGARIMWQPASGSPALLRVERHADNGMFRLQITGAVTQTVELGTPTLPARFALQLRRTTDNTAQHVTVVVSDRNSRRDFRVELPMAAAPASLAIGVDIQRPGATEATFGEIVSP